METEETEPTAAEHGTNGAAAVTPDLAEKTIKPSKSKPRKTRNMGTLVMAFVGSTTLEDGQVADAYVVPRGQPDFGSVKEVKDFIGACAGNGDFEFEFEDSSVAIVRLAGDPFKVTKEVKTTVSFV
jgi:hypothetical protein